MIASIFLFKFPIRYSSEKGQKLQTLRVLHFTSVSEFRKGHARRCDSNLKSIPYICRWV